VLGVLADDANDATAVDDLALVTDRFYGCTDLHKIPSSVAAVRPGAKAPFDTDLGVRAKALT
jgi:hypothetical protein